jgi:hypothetical protein
VGTLIFWFPDRKVDIKNNQLGIKLIPMISTWHQVDPNFPVRLYPTPAAPRAGPPDFVENLEPPPHLKFDHTDMYMGPLEANLEAEMSQTVKIPITSAPTSPDFEENC